QCDYDCKVNRSSLMYVDPFGGSWLRDSQNSRAVMLPDAGVTKATSFCCKRSNVPVTRSPLRRRGEPDPPALRASVRCGLNFRCSRGTATAANFSSISAARETNSGSPSIPIQKTRADFAVGKNPYPRNVIEAHRP